MSKSLRISYDGLILFDGLVDEFAFADSDNAVSASGRMVKQSAPSSGNPAAALLGALAKANAAKKSEDAHGGQ